MGLRGPRAHSKEERIACFNAQVDKSGDCWLWLGSVNHRGYGRFNCFEDQKDWLAHRVSFVIANGPIPDGMRVLHRCDNPPCVNPTHLFLGTPKDNTQDSIHKGRFKGVKQYRHLAPQPSGRAKLKDADISEIKRLYKNGMLQKDIAPRFGVHFNAISRIVNNKTYRHITGD